MTENEQQDDTVPVMEERDQMALAIAAILHHIGGECVVSFSELEAATGCAINGQTDPETGATRFWLTQEEG